MSASSTPVGAPAPAGTAGQIVEGGLWSNNPICCQVLGVCSALAVTNRLENSLVMGAALIFVLGATCMLVSVLRRITPRQIRMIAEVSIIATFVILFDLFLKAFYWEMSKQLGPYVGLIITNCIVMGRAEAFAIHNSPGRSLVDGLANGLGYAVVLALVGAVRELAGTGRLLGYPVLSANWYEPNQVLILAPGAFFALGLLVWIVNAARTPSRQP